MRVEEGGDAFYGSDVLVGPDTCVVGGDSTGGLDSGGFDYGEGGSAESEGGEMGEVEVVEVAVDGGEHAHWGDPWERG